MDERIHPILRGCEKGVPKETCYCQLGYGTRKALERAREGSKDRRLRKEFTKGFRR